MVSSSISFIHSFGIIVLEGRIFFYYVGSIVPEGSTIFYYIGIIIQAEYFFIMLEQFSSFKKNSVLENNFNKKTHPNILKWDLVLKISL